MQTKPPFCTEAVKPNICSLHLLQKEHEMSQSTVIGHQCNHTQRMTIVNMCDSASCEHAEGRQWWNYLWGLFMCRVALQPTLSVSGMSCVDVEGLLTLPDGSSQRKVRLHHPLLVVAIDNSLRGHRQRVTLGHVLGQGGQWLFGLRDVDKQMQTSTSYFLIYPSVVNDCVHV